MRIIVKYHPSEGVPQNLIVPDGTKEDMALIKSAMKGNTGLVISVACRAIPEGPVRKRLLLAGCIQSVTKEKSSARS